MEGEQGMPTYVKATASGLMAFLLGGFLDAGNKVLPMGPEAYLHIKRPPVWEDKIFQNIFNKKLIDVGSESNNRHK